jgi:8-amino-7-oxononanoate synthase
VDAPPQTETTQGPARAGRSLDAQLAEELDALSSRRLRRAPHAIDRCGKHVEIDGRRLLNLASNDYLGLAQHPAMIAAAAGAAERYGVGAGASRLVSGTLALHAGVEQRFASFKHAEAALLMPTGYTANLAVLAALARPGDLVCQDKLNHASLIDAARAAGAGVRTYPHRETSKLERLLAAHAEATPDARRFIVTDSVFSMDGDCADLPALCAVADRHHAVLIVDEAHGTGVLGATGAGLAEHQGVAERVYRCGAGGVVVSTASKALGGLGGVVAGSRIVIDTLINRARPLIYTTAVPPMQAAVVGQALTLVRGEPERRARLSALCHVARERLVSAGWPMPVTPPPTPILPLVVGTAERALGLAASLRAQGVLGVAIRPPTVAPGTARVRLTLRADLDDRELDATIKAVGSPM